MGYNIFQAQDGEEALKIFEENEIDLMILDIMMPKKDGFEVLQEIRKSSNVPVLILSAVEDEKSQIKSFDLMVDGMMVEHCFIIIIMIWLELELEYMVTTLQNM